MTSQLGSGGGAPEIGEGGGDIVRSVILCLLYYAYILHRQRERRPNDFGEGGGAVVRSVILCLLCLYFTNSGDGAPTIGEGGGDVVQSVIFGLSKHAKGTL